jgi:hypothetical protein
MLHGHFFTLLPYRTSSILILRLPGSPRSSSDLGRQDNDKKLWPISALYVFIQTPLRPTPPTPSFLEHNERHAPPPTY